ncbi:MAG: CDP-diacylglycerol--glycerol-3-phosphate 3-phosphatidyltransferase [Clostridia bacterium]
MNLPNKLTIIRMCAVPVFVACFYIPVDFNLTIAAVIFILAYLTDIYDGYYARKHNLVTDFGKLMDPMADKLLTGSAFIMLLGRGLLPPIFGELFVFIIISREFIISGFRLVAVQKGIVIAAGALGKIKTILQAITISVILFGNPIFGAVGIRFDYICMATSAVFTVWSLIDCLLKNKKVVS